VSINSTTISGNLVRDCEVRSTQGGTAIATFTVAVNDRKKDQSGNWIDVPNYVPVVMFGQRAEKLAQYLVKGLKCCVYGKLRWSQWEDKQGQKRSKIEVVAEDIEFLSQRRPEAQSQPQGGQYGNYTPQSQYGQNMAPQGPQTGYQQPTGYQPDLSEEPIPFRKAAAR
jgi:single-strand DNA-binding protein